MSDPPATRITGRPPVAGRVPGRHLAGTWAGAMVPVAVPAPFVPAAALLLLVVVVEIVPGGTAAVLLLVGFPRAAVVGVSHRALRCWR